MGSKGQEGIGKATGGSGGLMDVHFYIPKWTFVAVAIVIALFLLLLNFLKKIGPIE